MTTSGRIERLRATNPDAVALATACALASRVEPPLLRRLRLLVAGATAAAEADLWFSDLLAGRDSLAMALDPMVAELLRADLRRPDQAALREAAATAIAAAHAGAHWSVRLEDRVHYLDVARPPDAEAEIDDLLVAALGHLNTEQRNARGIARWLLGAIGRLPRMAADRTSGRASAAAAMLHLDRQAPAAGLLDAGESEAWLPWVAQALPTVPVPVRLLDGAVVLGGTGPDTESLPVPDTDPLVVEIRWAGGDQRVRFRVGDPVQVETGAATVTLTTLAGQQHELSAANEPASAGLRFDAIKANLRPCLGRQSIVNRILESSEPRIAITGRPGSGTSTVLVAVTDQLRAAGVAVVEHFFAVDADEATITRSCLAQLASWYSDAFNPAGRDLDSALGILTSLGVFQRRRLVIAFDGVDTPLAKRILPRPRPGVTVLLTTHDSKEDAIELAGDSETCVAMIEHDLPPIQRAFVGPPDVERMVELADRLPRAVAAIIRWVIRQTAGTVTTDTIPAVLTTEWARAEGLVREHLRGGPEIFDVLRAAHNRHTWRDCESLVRWPEFWAMAHELNLVLDTNPDELVQLAVPEAADQLREPNQLGDQVFGIADTPIWTASRTMFAAAVYHVLALGVPEFARRHCTDLTALRRHYAEDRDGLVADLAAVAAATNDPDIALLYEVVHWIDVPPSAFASVLYDRLAERSALHVVPDLADVHPPLRVRKQYGEKNLQVDAPIEVDPGPVRALAPNGDREPGLITDVGLSTFGATAEPTGWSGMLGATRGPHGGFAVWTADRIWTGNGINTAIEDPIDHVTSLHDTIVIAGLDGTVTIRSWPGGEMLTWVAVAGWGVRVTAVNGERDGRIAIGFADGTISPTRQQPTRRGHRGAVRCIAFAAAGPVSGGDDGCLVLWSDQPIRHQSDSSVTCLDVRPDRSIVFGGADGVVRTWEPFTGETTVLARHGAAVRGVTATPDSVISWAESVQIEPIDGPPLVFTGFPGGVRDLVATSTTCTILCGDGSVRRVSPTATEPQARTCLAVVDAIVYAGVGDGLLRMTSDGNTSMFRQRTDIYTRATPLSGGVLASSRSGAVFTGQGQSVTLQPVPPHGELVAGSHGGLLATASGHAVVTSQFALSRDGIVGVGPTATHVLPADVVSLAVTAYDRPIAGLANGATFLLRNQIRTYECDDSPITAVTSLPDGAIVTGSAAGVVRCWPSDPAHGPAVLATRTGAITALASTGTWLISAGEDGSLLLWTVDERRFVHETVLGLPIVAMAAERDLAAARGDDGRLWLLDLDPAPDNTAPGTFTIRPLSPVDESSEAWLDHRLHIALDSGRHELTAVRVIVAGRQVPVTCLQPWPVIRPDGSLLVPIRMTGDQPIVVAADERLAGGTVELDITEPAAVGKPANTFQVGIA